MKATIAVIAGDGIGPEVVARRRARAARRSRTRFGHDFTLAEHLSAAPPSISPAIRCRSRRSTACVTADAVLLGAIGGPKWSDPTRGASRAGPAASAQRARRVRQPAAGHAAPGAARRLGAQAGSARRRGHHVRARAHRRHLLRREDAAPRTSRSDLCTYSRRRKSSASRASRAGSRMRGASASCPSTSPTCSRPRACGAKSVESRDAAPSSRTWSSSTCWSIRPRCT